MVRFGFLLVALCLVSLGCPSVNPAVDAGLDAGANDPDGGAGPGRDAGPVDAGGPDAGAPDAAVPGPDGGQVDAGTRDAGPEDGGLDAGPELPLLIDLMPSLGSLVPAFDGGEQPYALVLPGAWNRVAFTAIADRPARARIWIAGRVVDAGVRSPLLPIGFGPTPISIDVATDAGASARYVVEVRRGKPTFIKSPANQSDGLFGSFVALSHDGDTLAVGAMGEDSNTGAAYVYVRRDGGWAFQSKLQASNARPDSLFGRSVAMTDDASSLVIGAQGESSAATTVNGNELDSSAPGAGAAYVFFRDGGTYVQQTYLKPSGGRANDGFGWYVSSSPYTNAIAVGSDPFASGGSGAVTVFLYNGFTWVEDARIVSDGGPLGEAVSGPGSSGSVLVGSSNHEQNANPRIYGPFLYRRVDVSDWRIEARFPSTSFSSSWAISGDSQTVVLQSGIDLPDGGSRGAVMAYRLVGGGWVDGGVLLGSAATGFANFGYPVAVSEKGTVVVTGAQNEPADGGFFEPSGSAYIFELDGGRWSEVLRTRPEQKVSLFGNKVAVSGDGRTAAVATRFEASGSTGINADAGDGSAPNSGAVWVY